MYFAKRTLQLSGRLTNVYENGSILAGSVCCGSTACGVSSDSAPSDSALEDRISVVPSGSPHEGLSNLGHNPAPGGHTPVDGVGGSDEMHLHNRIFSVAP